VRLHRLPDVGRTGRAPQLDRKLRPRGAAPPLSAGAAGAALRALDRTGRRRRPAGFHPAAQRVRPERRRMIRVSIIVPAYNEEATILPVLERVRAQRVDGATFEIIVVNDASTDGTLERLKSRPDLYDTLVTHEKNGGKGAAVKSGLRAATGDYIL